MGVKLTDVTLVLFSVRSEDALLGDLSDWARGQAAVRLGEGFEIAGAGGDTATADFPLGDELFAQNGVVVQLLGHLGRGELDSGLVGFSLDELFNN